MSNVDAAPKTGYKQIIEDNFETSGPYIGRTKNTELAVEAATAQKVSHKPKEYYDQMRRKPENSDKVGEAAIQGLLVSGDPDVVSARSVVESLPDDTEELYEAYDSKVAPAEAAVLSDYDRLQSERVAHDTELLAKARDQEVDSQQVNPNN